MLEVLARCARSMRSLAVADTCRRGHIRNTDTVAPNGDCRLCVRERARSWKREQPFPCGHPRTIENTRFRSDGRSIGCGVCPPKKRPSAAKAWAQGEMKICALCRESKDVSEFPWQKKPSGRRYPSSRCRTCHNERCRDDYAKLPAEEKRRRGRRSHLGKFGIGEEDFNALLERAGGCCELCGQPEAVVTYGAPRGLAIDHDHLTGRLRGLLCFICNTRLGWLEQVGLAAILRYLGEEA